MKLIEQSWGWENKPILPLMFIEQAGRTCYQSGNGDGISIKSSEKFAKMIKDNGHHSVIEHVSASVRMITNRGVTHELVRHRLASFSQESTRYCNYGGKDMEFIKPVWFTDIEYYSNSVFITACEQGEEHYNRLLNCGWTPQQAREVLPNALKTEIVMTANLREWMHVFKLRCSKKAHPQIRALMISVRDGFRECCPILFDEEST